MTLTYARRTLRPEPEQSKRARPAPSPVIQARLRVGAANDPYELEADRVMRRVVDSLESGDALTAAATASNVGNVLRSPTDPTMSMPATGGATRIRRSTAGVPAASVIGGVADVGTHSAPTDTAASSVQGPVVDRKPVAPVAGAITRIRRSATASPTPGVIGAAGGGLDAQTESMLSSQIGGGHALDASIRRAMEPRFGQDFSSVRMHNDNAAHNLSQRISAEAFTVGNDIFMSRSAPAASTKAGQGLLAHELTHVVQQGGDVNRRLLTGTPEADDLKRMNAEGGNPKADPPAGRQETPDGENDEEEDDEAVAKEPVAEVKTKQMRVAAGKYRASHDRVHQKKKAQVASRSSQLAKAKANAKASAKAKGAVAIAASTVAKGGERAANQGKHGVLNIARSVGRLVGMDVNPSTTVRRATGTNTTNTAAGAYGAVDTEFIEPKFTVKLVGTTWQPILTNLNGTYGKITAPLPGGLSEINGPDQNGSRQQIKDLLNLDGSNWYMVRAVDAHESIHEDHIHDALNNVGNDIAQLFAALTVDQSVAPKASDAITAIKNLPGYNAITNLANPNNSQIRQLWDNEYVNLIGRDHYGPTINAEADVVEPTINKINDWRKKSKKKKIKKKWTCTDDSNAVRLPKGRKNP
jgi:Domain of unknown function (DUF4157)